MYLVEANPRCRDASWCADHCVANGLAVTAAVCLGTERDITRVVRQATVVARSVVSIGARCDKLDLAVDRGLGANSRGDIGAGAVDSLAEIAKNGATGCCESCCYTGLREPGDQVAVCIRNGRRRSRNIDIQLVGRNLGRSGVDGGHGFIQRMMKKDRQAK